MRIVVENKNISFTKVSALKTNLGFKSMKWEVSGIQQIFSCSNSKVNALKRCKIGSKLTIKIPERCLWRRSGVFIINFEHTSHLFLLFLLLTFSRCMFAGNELLIDCSFGLVLPDYHVTENLRKVICTVCITWTYGATSQEENNENNVFLSYNV